MTKQLAPIEELALATGLILKTTNLELCPSYLNKLEQLRQAAIRDFVSTLEPVACVDYHKPLYDLSEWSK